MRRKFFNLLFLSFLLLTLDYFNFAEPIRISLEPVIVNLKKTIYQGFYQLKYLPNILLNYNKIVSDLNENQELKNENRKLKVEVQNVSDENENLRRQLGAPLPPSFRFIPADVIAVSRHMEINIGRANGVKTGMSVVDGLTLIGRISQVSARRSQIQLLSDTNLQIPAITNRGSRGTIVGQLSEFIVFKSVLQKDPLFLEDILTTTGENGFPPKLLIGTVFHIDNDDAQVYKQAQVKAFSNPFLLKKVFVVEET